MTFDSLSTILTIENLYSWQHVTWNLRVKLDRIRNSCDVYHWSSNMQQYAAFLFRNVLVPLWSLKIHKRLTQRVTLLLAGWRIYLKFFHLDCKAIFIIEESQNLTCIAATPFFSLEIQHWSLFGHWNFIKGYQQRVTQLATR